MDVHEASVSMIELIKFVKGLNSGITSLFIRDEKGKPIAGVVVVSGEEETALLEKLSNEIQSEPSEVEDGIGKVKIHYDGKDRSAMVTVEGNMNKQLAADLIGIHPSRLREPEEFIVKCKDCDAEDHYHKTISGWDNCTRCESRIWVGNKNVKS